MNEDYYYLSGRVTTSSTTVPLGGFVGFPLMLKSLVLILLETIIYVNLTVSIPVFLKQSSIAATSCSITYGIWPSPTPSLGNYTIEIFEMDKADFIPVHDYSFGETSIKLVVSGQGFSNGGAHPVSHLWQIAVEVRHGDKFGEGAVDASNHGAHGFIFVKTVMVCVVSKRNMFKRRNQESYSPNNHGILQRNLHCPRLTS